MNPNTDKKTAGSKPFYKSTAFILTLISVGMNLFVVGPDMMYKQAKAMMFDKPDMMLAPLGCIGMNCKQSIATCLGNTACRDTMSKAILLED